MSQGKGYGIEPNLWGWRELNDSFCNYETAVNALEDKHFSSQAEIAASKFSPLIVTQTMVSTINNTNLVRISTDEELCVTISIGTSANRILGIGDQAIIYFIIDSSNIPVLIDETGWN